MGSKDHPAAQRRAVQTQGILPLARGSLVEVSNTGRQHAQQQFTLGAFRDDLKADISHFWPLSHLV